jgi:glycosyltransferase involved in cell wall biosynthesis
MALRLTYWGVFESNYPRNRMFIDELGRLDDVSVRVCHVPLFEKDIDKSRSYFSLGNLVRKGLNLALAYLKLSRWYFKLRRDTDVWMCGYIGQTDVIALQLLKRVMWDKTPLVFNPLVSVYDTIVLDRQKYRPGSLMAKLFYWQDALAFRLADHILIDTRKHAAFLQETFGLSEDKVSVVPVAAERLFFPETPQFNPGVATELKVQLIGKFIPLHGLPFVLEAADILRHENIRFQLVGGGQLEDDVRADIKKRALTTVEIHPWVPYATLPGLIAGAHVSLGIFDPGSKSQRVIPNKVYQSLAMGNLTITADSPAMRELSQVEDLLFLVQPGSGEALAAKIMDVFKHYTTYKDRTKFIAQYMRKHYHPTVIAQQVRQILQDQVSPGLTTETD